MAARGIVTIFILNLCLVPIFSQTDQLDFLAAHNVARAVSGVPALQWDDTVAAHAIAFARQQQDTAGCGIAHSPSSPYGENIFSGQGKNYTASDAVNSWVAAKQFYDYPTNSCSRPGQCGTYTQVVWKDTTKLGCGVGFCPAGTTSTFIICNYSPAGNFNGERPF
ncbi:hypothetical protein O6H91_01G116500 [Diphasiastrum complanatum]|uniref:Uncharacterized protein n=3 Tax=Diphasiastrum complanatum TaxID=34168 RepID=A0ACC2EV44_DIPCM|nr:hypothetical protein O6H91_01G010500 [Diphasiastrum complanatum]KAJ7570346.1 hypothetical protein O6H91_01G116500 [Diphasiastrum complanatum]KAJ7570347.1 hypothetical protein O6H91_01G116500 [Diphasiastrum complanatum]